jgi:copper homeostasis protein
MGRMLLEVIVQSLEDARAAAEGGADRLEIVRAIEQGGLTPSLDLVRAIADTVALPLRVMVRENDGYRIGAGELDRLQSAARAFEAIGVDGIVIGFADPDRVRMDELNQVLSTAPRVRVTFHRAFDALKEPRVAIPVITRSPQIDRLLTSGGDGTAGERAERLQAYAKLAGSHLTIVAGGGVDEAAAGLFARLACVREVHVGRAARGDGRAASPVSAERVAEVRRTIDGSG